MHNMNPRTIIGAPHSAPHAEVSCRDCSENHFTNKQIMDPTDDLCGVHIRYSLMDAIIRTASPIYLYIGMHTAILSMT